VTVRNGFSDAFLPCSPLLQRYLLIVRIDTFFNISVATPSCRAVRNECFLEDRQIILLSRIELLNGFHIFPCLLMNYSPIFYYSNLFETINFLMSLHILPMSKIFNEIYVNNIFVILMYKQLLHYKINLLYIEHKELIIN